MAKSRIGDFVILCLLYIERYPWIFGAKLHEELCVALDREVFIPQVFSAIEALYELGLVEEKLVRAPMEKRARAGYSLTESGKNYLSDFISKMNERKHSPNSKVNTIELMKRMAEERSH